MSAPQINISDVASLARLTLTPEETAKFSSQLGQILAQGKGFTTLFVRPLALWQLRAKDGNQAPPVYEFPETLNPPLS